MKKHPAPWFRKSDGWWYVQLGKEQIKLTSGEDNEEQAWREYHRVMAERGRSPIRVEPMAKPTVTRILNLFLDWSKKNHRPRTYEWYQSYLASFQAHAGRLRIGEPDRGEEVLQPHHVTTWLNQNPDWKHSRRCAVIAVKRAMNWAYKEGYITAEPLRNLSKPPAYARDRVLDKEERQKLFESFQANDPFRDVLFALEQTGARPGEVANVTAAQVNLKDGTWVFEEHKTASRTGEKRVVILTPDMLALTKKLIALYPEGPIFRNKKGRAWNRNAIRCRFRRVREKLGLGDDVVAYTLRHSFATDALEAGVGIAQVAEILGHKDVKMVMKHYSKLRDRRDHLREQILKATRNDPAATNKDTGVSPQ
jgi:integrase